MATIDELRARAELIAEEQQIGGNTAERVGDAFNMVADIIEAVAPGDQQAVLYNPQSPNEAQKAQARANIGAQETISDIEDFVKVSAQTFTAAQKQQARDNIGAEQAGGAVKNLAGSASDTETLIKAANNPNLQANVHLSGNNIYVNGIAGGIDLDNNGVNLKAGNSGYPNAKVKVNGQEVATKLYVDGKVDDRVSPIDDALALIEAVIPSQASAQNQLADKAFVNSSISSSTANFVGTFDSLTDLQAVQDPTNNDYGFVIETDAVGNEYYDRYKYNGTAWLFEYKVESTPFTAAQWAAIQSGITSALVTKLSALPTNQELTTALDAKADKSDTYTKQEVDAAIAAIDVSSQIAGKADKVANAVNGDFAGLDAQGNLVDSGKKASDFALQSNTYTKAEIGNLITPIDSEVIVGALPASGVANKVYRVPGTNSYTDYGWDGTQFVPLATYDGSIDADASPTIGSTKLVESGGTFDATQIPLAFPGKISSVYALSINNGAFIARSNYPLWYYKALRDVEVRMTYTMTSYVYLCGQICIVDDESDIVAGTSVNVIHTIEVGAYTETYQLRTGQCLCVTGRGGDSVQFEELTQPVNSQIIPSIYSHFGQYDLTGMFVPYSVIYTNQGVGNVVGAPTANATMGVASVSVAEGDVLYLTGHGGSSPRLWCFVDAENKILSVSDGSITADSLRLIVPNGASRLIANVVLANAYSLSLIKGSSLLLPREPFGGIAKPTDIPSMVGDCFYIANVAGTYTNFGGAVVAKGEVVLLSRVGGVWASELIARALPQIYAATQLYDVFFEKKAYYERYVKELYTIWPSGSYYFKSYNGYIYFGRVGLTARVNVAGIADGDVVPLTVYTSDDADYPVGMVVGYAVFSDIAMFGADSYTGSGPVVDWDVVSNKAYSPIIQAYLAVQGIEPEVPADVAQYPELDAPTDLWVVRGNQLRVYYRNLVKSSFKGYNIKCVSSVGNAYPEYYLLDADTVGDYNVEFNIVGNDDSLIRSKTIAVHVIAPMSAPSSAKKVLVCGASVIAPGYIAGELRRRLTTNTGDGTTQNPTGLNLANISFVGRKRGSVVDIAQEATGGWSWMDYATQGRAAYRFQVTGVNTLNINAQYSQGSLTLTIVEINVTDGVGNIRCTYSGSGTPSASGTLTKVSGSGDASITYTSYDSEAYNPFWNPNKTGGAGLDFKAYADEYCGGSVDVFAMSCGYNGIFSGTIAATIENYVKPFIRQYHADFPNGKFILISQWLPSPTGGMGANYGASVNWNWLTAALKLWELARAYEALSKDAEFSGYVLFCDLMATFDIEHSYPATAMAVNPRSTETEMIGTNGVHPTSVGQYELSDALYYVFNRIIF